MKFYNTLVIRDMFTSSSCSNSIDSDYIEKSLGRLENCSFPTDCVKNLSQYFGGYVFTDTTNGYPAPVIPLQLTEQTISVFSQSFAPSASYASISWTSASAQAYNENKNIIWVADYYPPPVVNLSPQFQVQVPPGGPDKTNIVLTDVSLTADKPGMFLITYSIGCTPKFSTTATQWSIYLYNSAGISRECAPFRAYGYDSVSGVPPPQICASASCVASLYNGSVINLNNGSLGVQNVYSVSISITRVA